MNYCLFNGIPTIVEESTDGQRVLRLACEVTVLSDDELHNKWRTARHLGYLSFGDYAALYRREYRPVLLPYDSLFNAGVVTDLPVGYWQQCIPQAWWSHKRLPTGFPSKEFTS